MCWLDFKAATYHTRKVHDTQKFPLKSDFIKYAKDVHKNILHGQCIFKKFLDEKFKELRNTPKPILVSFSENVDRTFRRKIVNE